MDITIIIPTYNRKDILRKCLKAIYMQTYPRSNFEIIVIDDGSTDGTEKAVKEIITNSPVVLRYFKQDNKGPAAARNVGIKNALSDKVLFIGDDIIATETLIEEHMKWHTSNPDNNIAILGFVTWSPEIKVTPFMYWLENGGPQFSYYKYQHSKEVSWKDFFTCNISLKKRFLIENGLFNEGFKYAAYEDSELGYRLNKKGLKLIFNKSAAAYHYHYTSLDDACKRMTKIGESSYIFFEKIGLKPKPTLSSPVRRNLNKAKFIIYYLVAKFYEKRRVKEKIFLYLMDYYWFMGRDMHSKDIANNSFRGLYKNP